MRILFLCNEYPPTAHGGIGSFVYTLAHGLIAEGHEVHVMGYDREVRKTLSQDEDGVLVTRLTSPFFERRYLRWGRYEIVEAVLERVYLSLQVRKYCRKNDIQLVESYDWGGPLWFHPGMPLIVRMHGAHTAHAFYERKPSSHFLRYVEKRNLKMADYLVGVTEHISRITLESMGLEGRGFSVIYNGIDTNLFCPMENISRLQDEVLFAGTVSRRKGIYEFFAAIPKVIEKKPFARFRIVGRLPNDALARERLTEELFSALNPDERKQVEFPGVRPYREMPKVYNRATCAVFPSLAEAYGLTCVEAMACGTPVIMTSRASGPELIENGVSGLLCEPTNHQALADAIIFYLDNASFREIIGQDARRHVQEKFDQNEILMKNVALYEDILL